MCLCINFCESQRFRWGKILPARGGSSTLPLRSRLSPHTSYENIPLERVEQQQPPRLSESLQSLRRFSSAESVHNSETHSVHMPNIDGNGQPTVMLNARAPLRLNQRIPDFILAHKNKISIAGKITEDVLLAIAAAGGTLEIADALSNDSSDKNSVVSEKNVNVTTTTVTTTSIINDIEISSSTMRSSTTTTQSSSNEFIPIGKDK